MLTVYESTATSFFNNGLGVLREFIKNPIIAEVLNGEYTLEFEYLKNGWLNEYLVENNIIKANGQPFRIVNIQKTLDKIKILAKHIAFDLNNNFLEDVAPTSKNGAGALDWILERTVFTHNFAAWSDIEDVKSARYVRKNVLDAFFNTDNSILNTWGGEFEFDNYIVKLHAQRGTNRGLQIRYGKNLNGVDAKIDFSVITKVMPKGYNGLLLPEKYVDSPLILNYPTPIIREIEFPNIKVDEETTEEQAYQLLRDEVNKLYVKGIDKPKVSIKIDFIELSKVEEYKNYSNLESAYLGDTVGIFIESLNITTEARIVRTEYDCLKKRFVKLELGTVANNIVNSQSKTIRSLTEKVESVNPTSILETAQSNATALITSAMGGYVVKTENELLIMDTDDTATATKVWRWNLNGLGYSSTGVNGSFDLAMTIDGEIVADFIKTGVLEGALLKAGSVVAESLVVNVQEEIAKIDGHQAKIATLETTASNISQSVSLIETKQADLETGLSETNTQVAGIKNSYDGVEILVENAIQSTNLNENILNEFITKIGKYFEFKENGLTIKSSGSDLTLNLDNDAITFKSGENTKTVITDEQVDIGNATITDKMQIGKSDQDNYFWVIDPETKNLDLNYGGEI